MYLLPLTGIPILYPWVMVSDESNVQTWERNAYYHKVDIAGNQLPYFDYITNKLVEDVQMVQVEVIGGNVDLLRESATVDNISLYRENEEAANINPLLCKQGIVNICLKSASRLLAIPSNLLCWELLRQQMKFLHDADGAASASTGISTILTA